MEWKELLVGFPYWKTPAKIIISLDSAFFLVSIKVLLATQV